MINNSPQKLNINWKKIIYRMLLYGILGIGAIVLIFPIIWTGSLSLKTYSNVYRIPPRLIPNPVVWSNYPEAWNFFPYTRFLLNSLLVCSLCALGDTLSSSVVAFGFARLRSRGKNILFALVLLTMMIPYQLIIIPQFLVFKTMRWLNTFKPLWVITFFGWPYFVFLFRQFFMSIPFEFDDAARIDGCSSWRIYWNIILPLSKPALATVAILSFVANWRNFLAPLIYLSSYAKYTIALGLSLLNTRRLAETPYIMAVAMIMILPPIIIFTFVAKYFLREISLAVYK